jgi:energy-coupling factor transporter ATP-binding protein EcfA2
MTVAPVGRVRRSFAGPSSPYLGLIPFGERDAAFFFGRSHEVAIVSANLRSTKLTVVYGPSGVGKSSLLMAGVIHELRNEADAWADERPFAACAVRSWLDDPIQTVTAASRDALEDIASEPLVARRTLRGSLLDWTRRTGAQLLLVLDQFEEYFQYWPQTPVGDTERLSGFDAELASIVNDPDLDVNVLISIREDAWCKLDRFEGHIPRLFANYLRVDNLDAEAAREAIVLPIETWNRMLPETAEHYEIEDTLVDEIVVASSGGYIAAAAGDTTAVGGTVGGRIEAPFLQLLLERLWRATVADRDHKLTSARLAALGGAELIVENHILEAIARLSKSEQAIASDCFRFLVSSDRTKIAQRSRDLADWTRRPEPQVTAALGKLCSGESGRILRAVSPPLDDPDAATYELFHDVLAAPILAWRRGHEARRARARLVRVAAVLLALAAVFAAISIVALIERHHSVAETQRARFETRLAVAAAERANHLYGQQQTLNHLLRAEVASLTERRRAAAAATAAQTAEVARLSATNAALTSDVHQLQSQRSDLDKAIGELRAANHATTKQVTALNSENAATAAEVNALPAQMVRLSNQLESLKKQHGSLTSDSEVMSKETAARSGQYSALSTRDNSLTTKADELGYPPQTENKASSGSSSPISHPHPVTAPQYSTPGGPSSSDALSRLVAQLQQQLARLLTERARLTNEAAWLRQDNAVLTRERAALTAEVAGLSQTELGLEAQQRRLQQSLIDADAEHAVLTALAARRSAQNNQVSVEIADQSAANHALQSRVDGAIGQLGNLQVKIKGEQIDIGTLIAFITPPVTRLETAAEDPALSPSLAGLLAVEAYDVSPYDADDPAHPGVYDALWIALSRLDQPAALALIAPVQGISTKLGTTTSSVLETDICGLETGGFTSAEWTEFLPAGAHQPAQGSPCTGA